MKLGPVTDQLFVELVSKVPLERVTPPCVVSALPSVKVVPTQSIVMRDIVTPFVVHVAGVVLVKIGEKLPKVKVTKPDAATVKFPATLKI